MAQKHLGDSGCSPLEAVGSMLVGGIDFGLEVGNNPVEDRSFVVVGSLLCFGVRDRRVEEPGRRCSSLRRVGFRLSSREEGERGRAVGERARCSLTRTQEVEGRLACRFYFVVTSCIELGELLLVEDLKETIAMFSWMRCGF